MECKNLFCGMVAREGIGKGAFMYKVCTHAVSYNSSRNSTK